MKHKLFIALILVEVTILLFLSSAASWSERQTRPHLIANQQLAKNLMLTDLALWSESRYSRHPSQADFFAPFQDFPSAIDHFPAGSMVAPPENFTFTNQLPEKMAPAGK